ncbi:hypothetical protein ACFQS6_11115 [Xanthomonas populi]
MRHARTCFYTIRVQPADLSRENVGKPQILTRSSTPEQPPASLEALADIALALTRRVELPDDTRYRLVGVGLSGFSDVEAGAVQGELFGDVPQAQ